MTPPEAHRAELQLQAEHAFVQLEAAVDELDRRGRRALHVARLITPLAVLVVSALLVRWFFYRKSVGT